jgi:CelD/BcsL family acetyltransferase involved in cellulose biosynthesis
LRSLAAVRHLSPHVLTTIGELHDLRAEWNALLDQAEEASVFQSWEWVTSWYEVFGQDQRLRVVTLRDEDGQIVAIVPCSLATSGPGLRTLSLLGVGADFTEYVDAIVHREYTAAVADALAAIWDDWSGDWDLLSLPNLPLESSLIQIVPGLTERGYQVRAVEGGGARRSLPDTWEKFYRSLVKSMKQNANNYLNRLYREGHTEQLIVVDDPARLDEVLDTFFTLHRMRAKADLRPPHWDYFDTPQRRAFLTTVARRLLERGWLWPCLLYVDGKVAAAQLALVYRGCLYRSYSGFDPTWAANGVMTILTRRCIERAIEHGLGEIDFLNGISQEKLRWGAQPRALRSVVLASPHLRSRASLALFRVHVDVIQPRRRAAFRKLRSIAASQHLRLTGLTRRLTRGIASEKSLPRWS